jgi:HEAT repeat protein
VNAVRLLGHAEASEAIEALCEALARPGRVGQEAMQALSDTGRPAVPAILAILQSSDTTARWHAAKALAAIAAPAGAEALVAHLEDEDAGVRWEAVHALSAIGLPALIPLLRRLCRDDLSVWLATGAERVLGRLAPLIPALHPDRLIVLLEHNQSHIAVPIEAHRMLADLADLAKQQRPEKC